MKNIGLKIRDFILSHKQMWVFSYLLIYYPWWCWLEGRTGVRYHVIQTTLDRVIPFCEYFIVPYYLWFLYIPAVFIFLLLADRSKKEFYRYTIVLYTGMTLFLVFSTLFPNIQVLRPVGFERNNIFTHLVQMLYLSDTRTNVFPSIHVYNSVVAHMAVSHSAYLEEHRGVRILSAVTMVSIVLSTMLLKQHSLIDVTGAMSLALIMEQIVYQGAFRKRRERVLRHRHV